MANERGPIPASRYIPSPGFYDLERVSQVKGVKKVFERYLITRDYNRSISFYEHIGMPLIRWAVNNTTGRLRPRGEGDGIGGTNYRLDHTKNRGSSAWDFIWNSVPNEVGHGIFAAATIPTFFGVNAGLEYLHNQHLPGSAENLIHSQQLTAGWDIFLGGCMLFNLALVGLQRYNRARMIKRVDEELKDDGTFAPGYTHWTGIDSRAVERYYQLAGATGGKETA